MIDFASEYAGIIGLLFFFTFFVATILWLLRPGAKEKAEQYACIPLNEDQD